MAESMEHVGRLPPPGRSPGRPRAYADEATAMRGDPGEWYRIRTFKHPQTARSLASHINQGTYKAFPKGEFEAHVRSTSVFVRYTGTGGS